MGQSINGAPRQSCENRPVRAGGPSVTLWHLELSHYSEKVRFALAYKGVEHRLRAPMPGLHGPLAMALTRSSHRRFPVLQMDGRTVADSTAIVAALEERFPEPPLYPSDPVERERALALEEHFDETLAPALRSYAFHQIFAEKGGIAAAIVPGRRVLRRLFTATEPLVRAVMRADYDATAARAAGARADLLAVADRIEAELSGGDYLVGDRFSVADLTGAALFTPLIAPPQRPYPPEVEPPALLELRDELEGRRAGQWVHEMYARHR